MRLHENGVLSKDLLCDCLAAGVVTFSDPLGAVTLLVVCQEVD
jgi:hypothetical protein